MQRSDGIVNLRKWDVDHIKETNRWEITNNETDDLQPHIEELKEWQANYPCPNCNTSNSMTPKQAIAQGADYLVIGRPITGADDPAAAAAAIAAAQLASAVGRALGEHTLAGRGAQLVGRAGATRATAAVVATFVVRTVRFACAFSDVDGEVARGGSNRIRFADLRWFARAAGAAATIIAAGLSSTIGNAFSGTGNGEFGWTFS